MLGPSSRRKLAAIGFASLCLAGLSGCYDQTTNGDESTYSFALWVRVLVILAGIIFIPAGWAIRKDNARWGWMLLVMGPVLLVLIAPSLFTDRVRVTPQGFEATYGMWFSPNKVSVRFEDVTRMQIVGTRGSRGRINYSLHCMTKSGQETVMALGDLTKNAVPEISDRAKEHGINIFVQEP